MPEASREKIDQFIAGGDAVHARKMLLEFWRDSPGLAAAGFVASRFEQLRPKLELTACKLAVLRSFTLEPLIPLLRASAFAGGIDVDARLGDFNTYTQEILDSKSWLYSWSPDAVVLAVQTRDIAPALWEQTPDSNERTVIAAGGETLSRLRQLIRAFRANSPAYLIIHALETPATDSPGSPDAILRSWQSEVVERINGRLRRMAGESRNIYVLDLNALIARRGRSTWHDERKWAAARMPIAAGELIHLAREWLRLLHPITGRICKAIAVDLDNTLWGGVVGEDGFDGIQLNDDQPAAPFRAVQRALLDLYRRGVLLAACSKNNPADAMEVIEKHPGMLLRPEHFATMRINWNDKADNLREIAKELNVGVDSIAFLDDNPAEREWIREQLPQVTVIELPSDPSGYAGAIRESPVFERLQTTGEDIARGRIYRQQRQRMDLQSSVSSLEEFYRSLQMRVRIEPVNTTTLARAAQLTQKTNQFNLTTRRYSEEQLAGMLRQMSQTHGDLAATSSAAGYTPSKISIFTLQVTDRFGDNGIVGVATLQMEQEVCQIETCLLSCRVIGRTVETAFLAAIADRASRTGAKRLAGWFIPTTKNEPAADFYKQHGFSRIGEKDGASYWELDLAAHPIATPPWITIEEGPT